MVAGVGYVYIQSLCKNSGIEQYIYWAAPKQLSPYWRQRKRKLQKAWRALAPLRKDRTKRAYTRRKRFIFSFTNRGKGWEEHKTLTFTTPELRSRDSRRWKTHVESKRTTTELITAFKEYCSPTKNITYKRHKLNTRNQGENESAIDQNVTELRTLPSTSRVWNAEWWSGTRSSQAWDRVRSGIESGLGSSYLRHSKPYHERTFTARDQFNLK